MSAAFDKPKQEYPLYADQQLVERLEKVEAALESFGTTLATLTDRMNGFAKRELVRGEVLEGQR